MTVRIQITYYGNVQGVGFRWNVMQIASSYSVTGYVKNLISGSVEMMVEGNQKRSFLNGSGGGGQVKGLLAIEGDRRKTRRSAL